MTVSGADGPVLWLYAIVDEEAGGLPRGLAGEPLEALRCGGLFTVAGRLEGAPDPSPESLREHDRTVREIAEAVDALLPMRFGQAVANADELRRLLGRRQEVLADALERVRGCSQVTVRLFPSGKAGANAPDPEPEEPDDELENGDLGPGRRYLRRRRRERRVPELEVIHRRLEVSARETLARRGPSPAIASLYLLVETARADAVVAEARAAGAPSGTRLEVSAPCPPYAFARGAP